MRGSSIPASSPGGGFLEEMPGLRRESDGGCGTRVDDAVFQSIKDANRTLIDTAMPIMQSVFEIVERSHFMLVLTDAVGYILVSIGDEMIMSKTRDMRYVAGALWNSQSVGTNAISVALDYDTAIQMVGPEHYCRSHHCWTCSAAPIHGENGEVIGCINMSGDADKAHDHTLGLVLAAVYGIEDRCRCCAAAKSCAPRWRSAPTALCWWVRITIPSGATARR